MAVLAREEILKAIDQKCVQQILLMRSIEQSISKRAVVFHQFSLAFFGFFHLLQRENATCCSFVEVRLHHLRFICDVSLSACCALIYVLNLSLLRLTIAFRLIEVTPFDPSAVNCASIDLRLSNEFRYYKPGLKVLDVKEETDYKEITERVVLSTIIVYLCPKEIGDAAKKARY